MTDRASSQPAEGSPQLLFADSAGNYYRVPVAAIERGRVPDEQKAALEEALSREDVSGFAFDTFRPVGAVAVPPPGQLLAIKFTDILIT